MKQELQDKLFEKYPKIFRQKNLTPNETLMCFGIETGDGWFSLLDCLCQSIQLDLDQPRSEETRQVEAVQVKEKFGGLRFYYTGGHDRIRGMVDLAESLSYKICDVCGGPGETSQTGWARTRCSDHQGAMAGINA